MLESRELGGFWRFGVWRFLVLLLGLSLLLFSVEKNHRFVQAARVLSRVLAERGRTMEVPKGSQQPPKARWFWWFLVFFGGFWCFFGVLGGFWWFFEGALDFCLGSFSP